ncbi:MAG: cation:proton antiporter [Micrococcales bacterium]|nr:cation:proton antiporter [Micrococcales bacterium]
MNIDVLYLVVGLALLLAVILPTVLENLPASAPIILIVVGVVVGVLPWTGGVPISPLQHPAATEHIAELTVIVALMGVGLAIDRPLHPRTWRSWGSTWRLLLIAMPMCIAAVAVLGWWAMGLTPAAALLLGAALAPTDPVLAADVQVGGPTLSRSEQAGQGSDGDDPSDDGGAIDIDEHDEVRFALTSEAGFNDAFAFPFVYAAIYLVTVGPVGQWGWGWLANEVLAKTAIGIAVGVFGGWALGRVAFRSRVASLRLADQGQPLLALAATLAVYGLTEVLQGWGFLAVFVSALTLRAQERTHGYHRHMHEVIERLELLLTLLLLMLVGVTLADGLLGHLTWQGAFVGLALILIVRPLCGLVALGRGHDVDTHAGRQLGPRERLATAFFGVRGVGSIYYVAYAFGKAAFGQAELLWATVAFTILASVLIHGITATPVMRWLDTVRMSPQVTPEGTR